jgi:hypothetical protein
VPIAEIADARTREQSVNIPRALVEGPGRRAEENDCLIRANLHPQVESSPVHLTDDWKLWTPLHAETTAVDGAVRANREGQFAA